MQHGRRVGTLPVGFDPLCVRSKTFLYDPRHGDFWQEGEAWIASRMLGPCDLDAVVGFERDAGIGERE